MVRFIDYKQRSVKKFLDNTSKWLSSLSSPAEEVICSCCALKKMLCPDDDDVVVKGTSDEKKPTDLNDMHFCVRHTKTRLGMSIGGSFNVEGNIIPNRVSTMRDFGKAMDRVSKLLRRHLTARLVLDEVEDGIVQHYEDHAQFVHFRKQGVR